MTEVPFTWVCCPACQWNDRVGLKENNTWGIKTVERRLFRKDIKEIQCGHPDCDYKEQYKA